MIKSLFIRFLIVIGVVYIIESTRALYQSMIEPKMALMQISDPDAYIAMSTTIVKFENVGWFAFYGIMFAMVYWALKPLFRKVSPNGKIEVD